MGNKKIFFVPILFCALVFPAFPQEESAFTGIWAAVVDGKTITARGDENGLVMMQDGQTTMSYSSSEDGFTVTVEGREMSYVFAENGFSLNGNGGRVFSYSSDKNGFSMMGEGGLALSWRVEDGKLVMRSGDEYIYFDRAGESEKPPAALAGNMFTGVWKGTVNGETITALGDENGLAMMQDGQTVMFFSFGKKGFTMMAGGQTMAISFSKNELAVSENGQAVTLFSFTKNEFTMMFREETIGFFIEDGKLAAQFDGRRILFDRIGG